MTLTVLFISIGTKTAKKKKKTLLFIMEDWKTCLDYLAWSLEPAAGVTCLFDLGAQFVLYFSYLLISTQSTYFTS